MAFPATPAPRVLTVRSLKPTLVSVAHSLQRQVRRRGNAHRWLVQANWGPLARAEFATIQAATELMDGQFGVDTWVLPGHEAPRGIWPGAPVANGAQAAGLAAIALKGFTATQAGVALRMDFIKFAGHAKVYQICADTNSDGAGNATLTIRPKLQVAIANNEGIVFANVPFTLALAADLQEFSVEPPMLYAYQLDLVEVP